jgi:ribosome biogenesis protein ENP2
MTTQIYNLSKGKTVMEFLEEAKRTKKALRYNDDFRRRLELLHDMQFKGTSSSVAISEDQNFICASGAYPPEIRMFNLSDLGMKFVRRLDHEIIQADFLSEDYRKLAMLCQDRTIEVHAQYGKHHIVRIPKFGRSMKYDRATCILYVASSSESIYRLDLEEGTFLSPFTTNDEGATHTSMALAPCGLPVCLAGLDNGVVQCWDTRDESKPVSSLITNRGGLEVRQMAWSRDAMQVAVGLDSGVVQTYDIRSSRVLFERDHRNDFPIVGLHFVSKSVLASADQKSVKIWDLDKNEISGFVESKDKINGLTFWPDSGLFFTPCDAPRVGTYFAPSIGPAPKWCGFLDTLSDELSNQPTLSSSASTDLYEDYIFLTREQLAALGAEKLIGSSVVKAYMHGYWMDRKVHAKLRDVSEPFLYEKYRQQKVSEELEKNRPMRMPVRVKSEKSKGAINARLQQQLVDKMSQIENKKENVIATKILEDSRFAKLWSNADYEIEEVRKTQEEEAFQQIGVKSVDKIDLKSVNRIRKYKKPRL